MNKLPQECREHIASFLGKKALNNLVLVSKNYHIYFTGSNLSKVQFQDSNVLLSRKLRSFLAKKPNEKHQAVRTASIALEGERYRFRHPRLAGMTADDALVSLIVDALSQMTELRYVSLALELLSDEQVQEFIDLLQPTQKWDKVKSLKLDCPTDVVCSVLNHCDAKALETAYLYTWYDSPEYLALKSIYPTHSLRSSLKRLCLAYEPPNYSEATDHLHDKLQGILAVTKDFPCLRWLFIFEETQRCWLHGDLTEKADYDRWEETLSKICDCLRSTSNEEFAFSIQELRLGRTFMRRDLGDPTEDEGEEEDDDPDNASDDLDSEDPLDDETDRWFSKLICRMGSLSPHLRTLIIFTGPSGSCYMGERSGGVP